MITRAGKFVIETIDQLLALIGESVVRFADERYQETGRGAVVLNMPHGHVIVQRDGRIDVPPIGWLPLADIDTLERIDRSLADGIRHAATTYDPQEQICVLGFTDRMAEVAIFNSRRYRRIYAAMIKGQLVSSPSSMNAAYQEKGRGLFLVMEGQDTPVPYVNEQVLLAMLTTLSLSLAESGDLLISDGLNPNLDALTAALTLVMEYDPRRECIVMLITDSEHGTIELHRRSFAQDTSGTLK